MEVFIRDEDKNWDISYDLSSENNSLDCKDHKPIIVKSLDQHDLEIRANERKKVCEEFEKWVNEATEIGDLGYEDVTHIILKEELVEELKELKGE